MKVLTSTILSVLFTGMLIYGSPPGCCRLGNGYT